MVKQHIGEHRDERRHLRDEPRAFDWVHPHLFQFVGGEPTRLVEHGRPDPRLADVVERGPEAHGRELLATPPDRRSDRLRVGRHPVVVRCEREIAGAKHGDEGLVRGHEEDGSRYEGQFLPTRLARVRVCVPRETATGERRVALTPDAVARLIPLGFAIAVEAGAGLAAGLADAAYAEAGAEVVTGSTLLAGADAVVRVAPPNEAEVAALAPGTLLIGFLRPLDDPTGVDRLRRAGVVAFAMESVPRITRAQSMDALSSQANIAGYKAVLLAADRCPKLFPLMMTAAGTVPPARVLVLGAGVAGLQAIATARRLGAVVSAFDVRPAVREQVESLGASFLDLGIRGEGTEGGYARELTPDQQTEQQRALEERIPEFDVVITTALVPGRPAPRLIPASAVARMRPGSVIVDLAAENGGNCEATVAGEERVVEGVIVAGPRDLPSRMASDASRLYARNVSALLEHLAPGGVASLDFEDEITRGACVTRTAAEVVP